MSAVNITHKNIWLRRVSWVLITISFFLFLFFANFVSAAEFDLVPASTTTAVGEEFTIILNTESTNQKVNVAEGEITFDTSILTIISISKQGSSLTLWTEEPTYSNSDGTIKFSGGSPAGFLGTSRILSVIFKAKKEGVTDLVYKSGSILAADGKGTDVYVISDNAKITITGEKIEEEVIEEPVVIKKPSIPVYKGELPEAEEIYSKTHPEEDNWYNKTEAFLFWDLPDDVNGVKLLISEEEKAEPSVLYEPAINEKLIEDLVEGIWYFFLQLRNNAGWSNIMSRKIQIDTTPPLEFEIALLNELKVDPSQGETNENLSGTVQQSSAQTGKPKIKIITTDALSGMAQYDVKIGDIFSKKIQATELIDGSIDVPPQPGGGQTITVKAIDKAGNIREVVKSLVLPEVLAQVKKPVEEELVNQEIDKFYYQLMVALLALLTGVFATMYFMLKRKRASENAVITKDFAKIRDSNDRIFSAIHDELKDQIDAMDKKPQLTTEERQLLESLNEVIDISAELIDTQIEGAKTTLRNM